MVRLLRKHLDAPDEVRTFPNGRVEIFEIGDNIVGKTVYEPGWRWSTDVKAIAGTDLCMYHHLGYCLAGRLHCVLEDGTSLEISAGEAFEIPPGHDAWVIGDEPWITVDFAGMRSFARPVVGNGERILSTILFTDIVDSTAMAVRLGDAAWRELLSRHNEKGRYELDRFRGREIDTTGDGFLALFDSSERAVRAAAGICAGRTRPGHRDPRGRPHRRGGAGPGQCPGRGRPHGRPGHGTGGPERGPDLRDDLRAARRIRPGLRESRVARTQGDHRRPADLRAGAQAPAS